MASTYLTRTHGSAPTNTTKATVSCWVKKASLANNQGIFGVRNTGDNHINVQCGFFNGKWYMWYKDGTNDQYLQDSYSIPRDVNGWYHVVFRFDTTDSTTNNRMRVYVNGESLGVDFDSVDQPAQDDDIIIGTNGLEFSIGRYMFTGGTFQYFDGSISHFHYCDGYSYAPTEFGETDSTTGEWKIKTNPSVSYGNNGFFVLKDGNSGTDQSGNGNNLTVGGGTLTKTEDNPSNVFATLNSLITTPSGLTYSNGNNTITTSGTQWQGTATTLAPTSGKYYWEAKYNTGSGIKLDIGRLPDDLQFLQTNNQSYLSYSTYGYGYQLNNSGTDYYCSNNTCTTWNSSRGNSTKIYMVAVDLDNGKMWIGADGTWFNKSGTANPVTGDDPLHDFSANLNGDPWYFGMSVEGGSGSHNANFGNGYFGTTAVSSAGTNASNIGIFEYDVPTGYTALCTKGINSF